MIKSLNFKLRLLLLLVAWPGVLVVVFQAYIERGHVFDQSRYEAERIADSLANTQRRIIYETRVFLQELAAAPPIQDPADPHCTEFLRLSLRLAKTYVNLGVPLADGRLLCNAIPLASPVNVADRPYFQRALTQQVFAMSPIQTDRAAGVSSINFAYPVKANGPEGKVVGVAVAVVSLDWWTQNLAERDLPTGTVAYIVDSTHKIAANYPADPSLFGKSSADVGLEAAGEIAAAGEIRTGPDGMRRVYHNKILFGDGEGNNTSVSVGIPIDAQLAAANWHTGSRLALVLMGLFLVWMLVRHLANRAILTPLDELTKSVGNLDNFTWIAPSGSRKTSPAVREFAYLGDQFAHVKTNMKAAEKAENQRREELEAVLNALPDLYFRINRDHVIVDYHSQDDSDLMMDPKEFIGKQVTEVLPQDAAQLFEENVAGHRKTHELATWEYKLEIEGSTQHFEARACPIYGTDETVLVVRNITGRIQSETALQLSAMVYENSSEGMIVTAADTRILTVNPALTRLAGYEAPDLIGLTARRVVQKAARSKLASGFRKARKSGKGWNGEIQVQSRDGETIPVWLCINAIFDDTNVVQRFVILVRDMTEQKKANETIWRQAHFDMLTGLLNRATLGELLDLEIQEATAANRNVGLLFMDLDGMKQVNDRLGHAAGDLILSQAATRLRVLLAPDETMARHGGDEFTVVLGHKRPHARAATLADAILAAIAHPFEIEGEIVHLTASVGIARFPEDAGSATELLTAADQAMYVAKASGRNRAVMFNPSIKQAVTEKSKLIGALQETLQDQGFDLHFQPIIDLKTNRITKAEALLRWTHPETGPISPGQFIPLAEEVGLIGAVGDWVFEHCCQAIPLLQSHFGADFQLGMNVSPLQLTPREDTTQIWFDRLRQHGVAGQSLIVEITESALLEQSGFVVDRLEALQSAGIQLALDDFGTGYSSMSYFLQHQIDYLKIDREFVCHLPSAPKAVTLCRTMTELAHRLGVKVIAEGIETPEQLAFLTEIGADFGQGFLLSPPMSMADLLTLPNKAERRKRILG